MGVEAKKLKLAKNAKTIENLLAKKGGGKAQIARILGVQRMTLNRFLKRTGLH